MTPHVNLGEDTVCWAFTPNGKFSTKLVYCMLKGEEQNDDMDFWRKVWNYRFKPQDSCFIWKVFCNGLMTSLFRWERGFSNSSLCLLCHCEDETSIHILRDCGKVKGVWSLVFAHIQHSVEFAAELPSCSFDGG